LCSIRRHLPPADPRDLALALATQSLSAGKTNQRWRTSSYMAGSVPSPEEFLQLPYYSWISRPDSVPLSEEEIATALFLDGGLVDRAAARLKVDQCRLRRAIRRSARLGLLITRLGA
jgi:hypothetical protein